MCVTPRIFVYLLNVCKFFVWQSQTDFRSRNVRPGAADIIIMKVMMTRLRFHLPIFFKHFKSLRRHRYFHHQWGARGAATVTNDHLSKLLTFLRTFYYFGFQRASSWLARKLYYRVCVFSFLGVGSKFDSPTKLVSGDPRVVVNPTL